MSFQEPRIEFLQSEPPPPADALARRQRRAALHCLPAARACLPSPARLAWAVFGIMAGVVAALSIVVVALVCLLLIRPAGQAASARATAQSESAASSGDTVLDSKGYILPMQRILVSPKVSGMIVKLHFQEGSHVKKGDVLAELEDVEYQADFSRAQGNVETARQQLTETETSQPKEIGQSEAEMERANVELSQLQADFERTRDLYFKQAASKTEYESAETKFRAAERHVRSMEYALGAMRALLSQKVATARSQLQEAEADLVKVRWRLGSCMVRAPSSGTILKKNAEEGNLASNGVCLCELADLSELEVELPIPENEIHKIKPGQRCKVRTAAFPDRLYDGVVSRVLPVANRAQSAIPIRVKISVPQEEEGIYLKPEMTAVVSFLKDAAAPRLSESKRVSSRSAFHGGSGMYVRLSSLTPRGSQAGKPDVHGLGTRVRFLSACG